MTKRSVIFVLTLLLSSLSAYNRHIPNMPKCSRFAAGGTGECAAARDCAAECSLSQSVPGLPSPDGMELSAGSLSTDYAGKNDLKDHMKHIAAVPSGGRKCVPEKHFPAQAEPNGSFSIFTDLSALRRFNV